MCRIRSVHTFKIVQGIVLSNLRKDCKPPFSVCSFSKNWFSILQVETCLDILNNVQDELATLYQESDSLRRHLPWSWSVWSRCPPCTASSMQEHLEWLSRKHLHCSHLHPEENSQISQMNTPKNAMLRLGNFGYLHPAYGLWQPTSADIACIQVQCWVLLPGQLPK